MDNSILSVSFAESITHVELQFINTFGDVFHGPMLTFFLVEELRVHRIYHHLHRSHIQDTVMKEGVKLGHMMKQEEFITMDTVTYIGRYFVPAILSCPSMIFLAFKYDRMES